MDKSQFNLPENEFSNVRSREDLDAFRRTPEKMQAGPFELVQVSARTMEDRRDTAVAIELKNGRKVTIPYINLQFELPPRAKDVIYKKLIEQERAIGGSIFQNGEQGGFSFWLDHKGSSVMGGDVSDWHLEIPNAEDPKNPYGVHVEASSWQLRKFHKDGKMYAMTIQDIERFVPAVYHYVKETAGLYPFDQDFDEVVRQIDLPANVIAMLPIERATDSDNSEPIAA